jgi:hypothetical protein
MAGYDMITFVVRVRPDLRAVEVVPCIGDRLLTDLIDRYEQAAGMQPAGGRYGGLVPGRYRFGGMDRHFRGGSTEAFGPRTPVLGCECGDWGDWPLSCRISVTDVQVVWDEFGQPHRPTRDYSRFGPFVFTRGDYEDALGDLALALA